MVGLVAKVSTTPELDPKPFIGPQHSAKTAHAPSSAPLSFRTSSFPLPFLPFIYRFPYIQNSTYGCFPFFTPKKMQESLTRQGIANQYTFTRPVATCVPKVLNTFTGIKYVFNDPARFKTVYDMNGLGDGYGFMLNFDEPAKHDADKALVRRYE